MIIQQPTIPNTFMNSLVGIRGGQLAATVTAWGDILPHDSSGVLAWHVADEDRWHSPEKEASVRQVWLDGTPVVETRMRIHGGDAVHRVYCVGSHGGLIVLEVENDSPSPIAVAFTRGDLITSRPPTQQPIMGIELPAGSIVLPIGHRSSIRVALSSTGASCDLDSLPGREQVVRGWLQAVEVASRLVSSGGSFGQLATSLIEARSNILLGEVCDPLDDPLGAVLDGLELVRMGARPALWTDELVPLAEQCFAKNARYDLVDLAHMNAGLQMLLSRGGETRAVRDAARTWQRVVKQHSGTPNSLTTPMSNGRRVAAVEQQLCVLGSDGVATLFPGGMPPEWRGANIEAYGLMAGGNTTVSFALRWHGENVAVLFEVTGDTSIELRNGVDSSWSTTGVASGEALWLVSAS